MSDTSSYFDEAALDMGAVVDAMRETGAASVPLLRDDGREMLLAAALRGIYRTSREIVGSGENIVRQGMDCCAVFPDDSPFHGFTAAFQALVEHALAGLGDDPFATPLKFDDLMLQRYDAGSIGITPHRDSAGYINVACLFTLAGDARLYLCADRAGSGKREIDHAPGTVVFLRAPGFLGSDERPFHTITEIGVGRVSFGLRQLREPATP